MSRRTMAWLVEQVEALEVAWQQGAAARKSLKLKGQRVTASSCTGMYNATVASRFRWDDERFRARGQDYFVAGCLGRGKPGSSYATTTST